MSHWNVDCLRGAVLLESIMTALSQFLCANATLMTMNGILGVRMYAVENNVSSKFNGSLL